MHTIRLRGPWQLEPVARFARRGDGTFDASADSLPPPAQMHVPADWSGAFGADFIGRVRYVRTFHAPPGLVPEERVWLVVAPQRSLARVMMEGEVLGDVPPGGPPGRFDITHRLSEVCRLEIFVEHPPLLEQQDAVVDATPLPPGGLVGEVWLEIEE